MVFSNQRKLLRWFLACVLLECFHNFSLDPYYEPLSWFMISIDEIRRVSSFEKVTFVFEFERVERLSPRIYT